MSSPSSSPLSAFSRTPSLPDSHTFQHFVIETSNDTIRVDTSAAVALPPLRRRSSCKGKDTIAKLSAPNPSNHLNDSEPAPLKRGRGRPRKTKSEPASVPAPNRSNKLNDSDLPAVAAAPAPAKRGRGRPPKRKAVATTTCAAPAAKKVRIDAPAHPNRSNDEKNSAPARPKRSLKLSAKAREALGKASAPPVLEAALAPAKVPHAPRPLTEAQKKRNAKQGYSGTKEAPIEERIHALDHWKEKGEVTEEIWNREFAAVLPDFNRSNEVNDRDDGEEEDMKLRASFYANETKVTPSSGPCHLPRSPIRQTRPG